MIKLLDVDMYRNMIHVPSYMIISEIEDFLGDGFKKEKILIRGCFMSGLNDLNRNYMHLTKRLNETSDIIIKMDIVKNNIKRVYIGSNGTNKEYDKLVMKYKLNKKG